MPDRATRSGSAPYRVRNTDFALDLDLVMAAYIQAQHLDVCACPDTPEHAVCAIVADGITMSTSEKTDTYGKEKKQTWNH